MLPFVYVLFLLQSPEGIPKESDNEPVDFTDIGNIVVYLLIPLLIIILYFVWRQLRIREERRKNNKD